MFDYNYKYIFNVHFNLFNSSFSFVNKSFVGTQAYDIKYSYLRPKIGT